MMGIVHAAWEHLAHAGPWSLQMACAMEQQISADKGADSTNKMTQSDMQPTCTCRSESLASGTSINHAAKAIAQDGTCI